LLSLRITLIALLALSLSALSGPATKAADEAALPDFPAGLSHLGVHLPGGDTPPPAPAASVVTSRAVETLIASLPYTPLPIENGTLLKGFSPVDEEKLVRSLAQIGLNERLLKVAISRVGKVKMGMIKVQAGSPRTGRFELRAVEEDAVNAMRAAFDPDLDLAHVDFAAVVAGTHNSDNDFHLPVFFTSADRETWEKASQASAPSAIVAGLGVTRYAPGLLRYAVDAPERANFPATAFVDPLMTDHWSEMLERARIELPQAAAKPGNDVRVVRNGRTDLARVAITIDDGPHPLITPMILEALKQAGVKATFFVIGKMAEEYPELLRRIVAEGHELGNHTYSHTRLKTLAPTQIWAEIRACDEVVYRLTGVRMKFLRPPGGGYDEQALRVIRAAGYSLGLWTNNTGDWRKPPVQTIVRNALRNIGPGGIILMHQGEPVSVEAIPLIVRGLRQMGLEPGTLSSIVSQNGHETLDNALHNQVEEEQPGTDKDAP